MVAHLFCIADLYIWFLSVTRSLLSPSTRIHLQHDVSYPSMVPSLSAALGSSTAGSRKISGYSLVNTTRSIRSVSGSVSRYVCLGVSTEEYLPTQQVEVEVLTHELCQMD